MDCLRVLIVAGVFTITTPLYGVIEPPPPCGAADKLAADAYQHVAARAAYDAAGDAPCANHGRKVLADSWLAAKTLYDDGRRVQQQHPALAQERYLAALQLEPTFADAANALAALGKAEQTDAYAGALALDQNGFRPEAITLLKTVLASGRALPEKLEHLTHPKMTERVENWLEDHAEAIAYLLGLLALTLLTRALTRPAIEIADFQDDSLTLKVGRDLAAMTRERLKRFQTTYEPKLGRMSGPRQAVSLPDQLSKSLPVTFSWMSLVPSLFAFLRPRADLIVEGYVHVPSIDRGAGITLTMTRRGQLKHTSTLWQKEFNPAIQTAPATDPSGFYELAEPAAIWMLFRIHEETSR
jgi:hypothetical protein